MSFHLTEAGLPYFRTRYRRYRFSDGTRHPQIRGRFELRLTNPADPSEGLFSRPREFMYDSGAELSVVSEQFAEANGFGDFRETGERTEARSFDDSAPLQPAWVVPRWVRFRDWDTRLNARGGEAGGIPDLMFLVRFAVVAGADVGVPIFGLEDAHTLFTLGSVEDEYWFILRVDDDGIPPQWEHRVRRIS